MDLQPDLFVDLDLPETCKTKSMILRKKEPLAKIIFGDEVDASSQDNSIDTKHYILHPLDLTDLASLKCFI